MQVGQKIRELRKARNLKLKDLAEQSGVQIATLSRIEHQKMTGTLESHLRVARVLGVDLVELYQGITTASPAPNPTASQPESFSYNDKASYEIVTGQIFNKKMLPIVLRVEEGGATSAEQNAPGAEKFIFVLEGQARVHIDDRVHTLKPGDTLYFNAAKVHHIENPGPGVARIISVVTPVQL